MEPVVKALSDSSDLCRWILLSCPEGDLATMASRVMRNLDKACDHLLKRSEDAKESEVPCV